MITSMDAVVSLRPGVELTLAGDDIDGIQYNDPSVVPVTRAEVATEMQRLEAAQAQTVNDADAKRLAALDKLLALGLTVDDLTALGL
jgi:hypothetical protein